jgi:pyruvate formate lyase activating enzyme
MGTLDGPGIRYVLFLQGCCFRCLFCHNPDTWSGLANVRSVDEVVEDVLKYQKFYDSSGGGVTVSGGEPLLQIPFLIEFFKRLKDNNIHTAIDTCGYIDISDDFRELMNYTDLFMLDIKHLDNDVHKKLTGKDNIKVLKFLKFLDENDKRIWIRKVLVPDISMDEKYIMTLIEFLKDYHIEKVELLPYHDMGREKYEKLGIDYPLTNPLPTKSEIQKIKSLFLTHGFTVT